MVQTNLARCLISGTRAVISIDKGIKMNNIVDSKQLHIVVQLYQECHHVVLLMP